MGTQPSAGASLIVGCLFWLPVIGTCVVAALVAAYFVLGR